MSGEGVDSVSGMPQAEAFARIRLLRSPNIGPATYTRLIARMGSGVAAIEALPDLAGRGGKSYRAAPTGTIEAEIDKCIAAGARYLFHDSPEYPALLAKMVGAPPILTIRGNAGLAMRPCVAIVGARNASAAAMQLARHFASGLSRAGYVVVSGLARGIDGAAHRGAFPQTIGVIASGIDVSYPPEHAEMQEKIAQEGLLIAEQPPGTEPLGRHFPTRNRIIAGLASGTLVVEAAPKSGSLITARLAGEAGREVMAIPGSPLEPRSMGCNQLIREGAILVQSVAEIDELISDFDGEPKSSFREIPAEWGEDYELDAGTDEEAANIEHLLSIAPVAVDELIRQSGASPASVQLALLELEVAGRLERHAGGRVNLMEPSDDE